MLFGLTVVASFALAWFTAPFHGWLWWASTVAAGLVVLLIALNRWLAPELTGWSLGRALFGIAVVRRDGEPAGFGRLLARDLAHVLDTAALFVGWLWPLWDSRQPHVRRPAASHRGPSDHPVTGRGPSCRRRGADGRGRACRGDRRADLPDGVFATNRPSTRPAPQIADQGPRIVEQILTYNAGTMKDDFARAQTLVTDDYREQLVQQQQVVREERGREQRVLGGDELGVAGDPRPRDNAAVPAGSAAGRAAGGPVHHRDHARHVREIGRDGTWRVSDLTVLAQPTLNRPGQ